MSTLCHKEHGTQKKEKEQERMDFLIAILLKLERKSYREDDQRDERV